MRLPLWLPRLRLRLLPMMGGRLLVVALGVEVVGRGVALGAVEAVGGGNVVD